MRAKTLRRRGGGAGKRADKRKERTKPHPRQPSSDQESPRGKRGFRKERGERMDYGKGVRGNLAYGGVSDQKIENWERTS